MTRLALLALLGLALIAGSARADRPVIVGSKAFTESRLLGELMAQIIEARTELRVERREALGGTSIVFGALQKGDIDVYAEYTGTAWSVLLERKEPVRDPLRAYLTVQQELRQRFALRWLRPFGFSNSYALAMARPAAERLGVSRVSDLLPHARELRAGLSHEFLAREDGYPGLAKAYRLDLGEVKGMEHGLSYEAMRSGAIDLVDTYTTDGKLLGYDVVVLEDDRRFFPPYDAVPLARADLPADALAALDELAFALDDATMRELNHRAEEGGGRFAEVAAAFLAERGLAGGAARNVAAVPEGMLARVWHDRGRLMRRTAEHLLYTVASVLLAILVALPAGIALTRRRRLAGTVLGAAGVIQTIPGLALLAFLIALPGFGLGVRSAVAALFLYALLPIVQNSYTGVAGVDRDLLEAARGIGLTERQILRHVELPLAARTIMAGIRTATVITVGVCTLAAFVGAGGLGELIITGLQLDDGRLVLSGAVPAALLALCADFGLRRLERVIVPRGAG